MRFFTTPVRLFFLAMLLSPLSTLAHHGFGGNYDRSAPIYLEGTIEETYFGYPHAEVVLRIDPDVQAVKLGGASAEFTEGLLFWHDDLGLRIDVEFPPVTRFFDLDGRVTVGDRIAVIVLRNCERPHQLRGQWILPADGMPVIRSGRMQSEVYGC